ncbi:hypothetical protein [Erysipelothrix aquatica]|uniref:hypothetical protein n=1 Tax=Erysipelothrix aquatica TaxID=2683714 RepID=UPI00135A6BEB|nr:hypothetical protein [Erysipelothrix aquatica]
MSKKYIDDFIKLPVSKMAQKMSDITYLHEHTEVPKAHYQKILQREVIEMMAQDSTMECVLLNAVLGQLLSLQKESPKLFLKALVCMEKGIKIENMNNRIFDSLEITYQECEHHKEILNEDISACYDYQFENHKKVENEEGNDKTLS